MTSTVHATVVATAVAAGIYLFVPPFVPVLAAMGPDLPLSGSVLAASYPFAFALPLAAAAAGLRLGGSRWGRLVVPVTYVIAFGLVCLVALVLSVPMFELS